MLPTCTIRVLGTGALAARPQIVRLDPGIVPIGRAGHTPGALGLHDPECSREHARLVGPEGAWSIEDQGSRNGTFVGGGRIQQMTPLADPAVIRVGKTLLLFACADPGAQAPLGDRPLVVLALAQAQLAHTTGAYVLGIDAAEALLLHRWPGGDDELEDVMRQATARARGRIELTADHLPPALAGPILARRPRPLGTPTAIPIGIVVSRDGVPSREDFAVLATRMNGSVTRLAEFFGKDADEVLAWAARFQVDLDER